MSRPTRADKNFLISAMLVKAMCEGKTVQEAFDSSFGVGTFEKLASEVYDHLRKEGLKQ